MQNRVRWLRESLAFLLLVVAMTPVQAQGQPFPTFKGGNTRVGHNGSPSTSFPGAANLNWAVPSLAAQTTIDNTDGGSVVFSAGWQVPDVGGEAAGPWWPSGLGDAYRFATCVPADPTDFTLPKTGFTSETAVFTLSPADATARDYGVYVHFPDGPTTKTATNYLQMKYAVIKVTPSAGASFTDVVQVDAVGKGWVRLGNGGLATGKQFHYDGTTPITVTLYNTVPTDSAGTPLDTRVLTTVAVYADAVRLAPDLGSFVASPTVFQISPTDGRVITALNLVSETVSGDTVQQGEVASRDYSTGGLIWKWSPGSGAVGTTVDNQDPPVSPEFPFVSDVSGTAGTYLGSDYFSTTITNDNLTSVAVGYSPTLDDGDYYIYFHTVRGGTFGQSVEVDISEDGGTTFSQVTIDLTAAGEWVKIGTRRYNSKASSLQVYITNYSASATDAGKLSYADALRFEGKNTGAINSTPVQAKIFIRETANSIPVLKNVVLVATEQGKIYCLDATGNGDLTTKVYWTYPSSTTPDPNQVAGKDGAGPLAITPTLFNMSSALVQSTKPKAWSAGTSYHYEDWVEAGGNFYISMTEPNAGVDPTTDGAHTNWAPVVDPGDANHAQDRLFIGASNGRVYSIDMTGRGDYTATEPGTTARCWTYPDDYPSTVVSSALGAFKCSLAHSDALDNAGNPVGTIYAATAQGRIYALEAAGDPTTRATSIKWTYPLLTDPPRGAFTSTPAIANGRLYVGTAMRDNGALPAEFMCLKTDSDIGATPNWGGNPIWSLSTDGTTTFDNFFGGPTYATAADLNAPFATSMTDTVYAANQNRYVYAFDAADGTIRWKSRELNAGVQGPLTFTYLTVPYYDTVAAAFNPTPTAVPVIMVPTENGHVAALYANTTILNRVNNGSRRAYEFDMEGGSVTGIASGYGWMYSTDSSGYTYAFTTVGGSFGGSEPPGTPVITENDPRYDRYVMSKIKLITAAGYKALRAGTATYADINGSTYDLATAGYEYGQTLYALVYNYPYDVIDKDSNPISPPIANFNLSVEGATLTSVSSNSQQIGGAPFDATIAHDLDGYSLLTFTVDLAGTFSLPPGNGIVQATLTSAFNGASQPYALSAIDGEGEKAFNIANPIGLQMVGTGEAVGVSTDGSIAENKVNGTPATLERITASTGNVSHGASGASDVIVYDRSLMTLKRGDGLGLGFVRAQRNELSWRWPSGGTATDPILNPLPSWASSFEDYPVNQPNTSRDYPDIRRDRITVTKDPAGSPQNPIFNGVELAPPTGVDESNPLTRTMTQTPFRLSVEVPLYQPANTSAFANTTGSVPGGYAGQMVVFVDSTQTGVFDITSPKRSAYRTFYLATAVTADPKVKLGQSVIDLKSLSGGAGFSTTAPWVSGGAPAPWPDTAPNAGLYQPMDVYNMGNVNLLNVRLAHGRNIDGTVTATPFGSTTVDPFGWLDSRVHLFSDLDPQFWDTEVSTVLGGGAPGGTGPFAVKPRVGDRQPAKMSINPRSRLTGNALLSDPDWPAGASPKVGIVVPLGFPAGSYSHTIRVIEDVNENGLLDVTGTTATESYSDPTAVLKFKVAETRLTNGFSLYNIPMIDPAIPSSAPNSFKNKQPTGMRTPDGHLVVAWISDRANPGDASYSTSTPTFSPVPAYPGGTVLNPLDRLYVAAVAGDASTPTVNGADSPLGDLSKFIPQAANWFAYRSPADPFPKDDAEASDLLGTGATNVRMHHPSLPTLGSVSPIDSSIHFAKVWLGVVGDAKIQASAGISDVSRVFLAPVTTASGVPALDSAAAGYIEADDASPKGKPSVVQIGDDTVVVFYASGGAGQSRLNYDVVDTSAFSPSGSRRFASTAYSIDLPTGFEMSGAPSAVYRQGTVGAVTGAFFDVAFVGKLAGRPNTEAFMLRLPVDITTHLPSGGIIYFPPRGDLDAVLADGRPYEPLLSEGGGVYRAKGVGWDLSYGFGLEDYNRHVSLIDVSKRKVDLASGIVTYPSPILGGQVYLDINRGTVRFSSSAPLQSMDIRLSYKAAIMRVSDPSASGNTGVNLVYDNHPIDDVSYWKDASADTAVTDGTLVRASRFVATYNRAASGAGQAARPYWKTMRQGIQLDRSLFVDNAGAVDIHVTGLAAGFYQVDPVKGRVYFADNQGTLSLEGVTVAVTYTGLDQTTGAQVAVAGEQHTIGLIDEMDESAVPIDVPVNENGLATFFDPLESSVTWRRPTMLWMIWSSARGNGSDLYMQTVAPQLIPVAGQ